MTIGKEWRCRNDGSQRAKKKAILKRSPCDSEGIRTPNLLGRNQVHYPIMLRNHHSFALCVSLKRGANIGVLFLSVQALAFFFLIFFSGLFYLVGC